MRLFCRGGGVLRHHAHQRVRHIGLFQPGDFRLRQRQSAGLYRAVKAGKVRYIGISNCFAWQLCKANALAEREGWAKFVSIT